MVNVNLCWTFVETIFSLFFLLVENSSDLSVSNQPSPHIQCPFMPELTSYIIDPVFSKSQLICALIYSERNCAGSSYFLLVNKKFYDFGNEMEKFKNLYLSAQINPDCNLTICSNKNFTGRCKSYIGNAESTIMTPLPLIGPVVSLACYCDRSSHSFASRKVTVFNNNALLEELDLQIMLKHLDEQFCAVFYENSTKQGNVFNLNTGEKRTLIPMVLADRTRYAAVVNENYSLIYCTESYLNGDCDLLHFGRFRFIVGQFPIRSMACIHNHSYKKPKISSIVQKFNCVIITDNSTKSTIENHLRIGRDLVMSEMLINDQVIFMASPPNCMLIICSDSYFRGRCYSVMQNNSWSKDNSSEITLSVIGSAACNCHSSAITKSNSSSKTSAPSKMVRLKKRYSSIFTERLDKDLCVILAEHNIISSEYKMYLNRTTKLDDFSKFLAPKIFFDIRVMSECVVAYFGDKQFQGHLGVLRGDTHYRYPTDADVDTVGIQSLICYCGQQNVNLINDTDFPYIVPNTDTILCAAAWMNDDTHNVSWIRSDLLLSDRPYANYDMIRIRENCTLAFCSERNFYGRCRVMEGASNTYKLKEKLTIQSAQCACGKDRSQTLIPNEKIPLWIPDKENITCAVIAEHKNGTGQLFWIPPDTRYSAFQNEMNASVRYVVSRPGCEVEFCDQVNLDGSCVKLNSESRNSSEPITINSLACKCGLPPKSASSEPVPWWAWLLFSMLCCTLLTAAAYWYWRSRSAGKPGIDASQLEFLEELGSGQFGAVYRGVYKKKRKNRLVALKIQKCVTTAPDTSAETETVTTSQTDWSMTSAEGFFQEALILNFLHHRNVIVIYGICMNHERAKGILVLELMNAGCCSDYVSNFKMILSHCDLLAIADHVATGCKYIADNGIVHCDISARNVLIETLSACHKLKVAKITDFGVARDFGKAEQRYKGFRKGQFHPRWTAPEAMKKLEFSPQSDVWSFGIFLWELYGQLETPTSLPYNQHSDQNEIIKFIDSGQRLICPYFAPLDVFAVAEHCWAEKPSDRPTFEQLINSIDILRSNYDNLSEVSILSRGSTHMIDDFDSEEDSRSDSNVNQEPTIQKVRKNSYDDHTIHLRK